MTTSRRRVSRSFGACDTCKRAHVRCSEAKPACARCVRRGVACVYNTPQPWVFDPSRPTTSHALQPHVGALAAAFYLGGDHAGFGNCFYERAFAFQRLLAARAGPTDSLVHRSLTCYALLVLAVVRHDHRLYARSLQEKVSALRLVRTHLARPSTSTTSPVDLLVSIVFLYWSDRMTVPAQHADHLVHLPAMDVLLHAMSREEMREHCDSIVVPTVLGLCLENMDRRQPMSLPSHFTATLAEAPGDHDGRILRAVTVLCVHVTTLVHQEAQLDSANPASPSLAQRQARSCLDDAVSILDKIAEFMDAAPLPPPCRDWALADEAPSSTCLQPFPSALQCGCFLLLQVLRLQAAQIGGRCTALLGDQNLGWSTLFHETHQSATHDFCAVLPQLLDRTSDNATCPFNAYDIKAGNKITDIVQGMFRRLTGASPPGSTFGAC